MAQVFYIGLQFTQA